MKTRISYWSQKPLLIKKDFCFLSFEQLIRIITNIGKIGENRIRRFVVSSDELSKSAKILILLRGRSQTSLQGKGLGGQKNRLFVNHYTIENVNGGG